MDPPALSLLRKDLSQTDHPIHPHGTSPMLCGEEIPALRRCPTCQEAGCPTETAPGRMSKRFLPLQAGPQEREGERRHLLDFKYSFLHLYFNLFKLKGVVRAREEVAQRISEYPISGNVQSKAGCGPGQPDLMEDVHAHVRGIGTRPSSKPLPTQSIL